MNADTILLKSNSICKFVFVLVVTILVFWATGSRSYAQTANDVTFPIVRLDGVDEQNANVSDCGIYAMGMAIASMGCDVNVERYLNRKYVSNRLGSSPHQLITMANEIGLTAKFADNVCWAAVRDSKTPVLLLLRQRESPGLTGHWVTFLGMEGASVLVFDSGRISEKTKRVSPSDLLILWQGQAIFVGNEASTNSIFHLYTTMLMLVPIFISTVLARLLSAYMSSRNILQPAIFTLGATAWFASFGNILFDSRSQIKPFLEAKYSQVQLPEQSITTAMQQYSKKCVRLVDAREPADFNAASIPGSSNLHLQLSMADLSEQTSSWNIDDPIVVYCSGVHCGWGEVVAKRLRALGFDHVLLSRESISKILEESQLEETE